MSMITEEHQWRPLEIGRTRLRLEHIGRLVRISFSGYRGRRFEPRHHYVVSLSKTLYPHCFSRLSCGMSTRWGQPREGIALTNHAFFLFFSIFLYSYLQKKHIKNPTNLNSQL